MAGLFDIAGLGLFKLLELLATIFVPQIGLEGDWRHQPADADAAGQGGQRGQNGGHQRLCKARISLG